MLLIISKIVAFHFSEQLDLSTQWGSLFWWVIFCDVFVFKRKTIASKNAINSPTANPITLLRTGSNQFVKILLTSLPASAPAWPYARELVTTSKNPFSFSSFKAIGTSSSKECLFSEKKKFKSVFACA